MIYDCFLYNGEADMLELRLHELGDVVDRFVLVEGHETFTGELKPLPWAEHQRREPRFAAFLPRIAEWSARTSFESRSAWEREGHQRNAIGEPLRFLKAQPDDIILVSDVDEIPSRAAVMDVRDDPTLRRNQCAFQQTVYFYHPQCLNLLNWYGTRSIPYRNFRTAQELRATEYVREWEIPLSHAGWHFSYFLSPEDIQRKLASYSHTEVNVAPYNTRENIEAAMRECRSLVPTDGQRFQRVTPRDLPAYMLAHPEQYGLEVLACAS